MAESLWRRAWQRLALRHVVHNTNPFVHIVKSGARVFGSLAALALTAAGLSVVNQLLLVALLCLPCAWLAWRLHKACDGPIVSR